MVPSFLSASYKARERALDFPSLQMANAPSAVIISCHVLILWARICQVGVASTEGSRYVVIPTSGNGFQIDFNTGCSSYVSMTAVSQSRRVFQTSPPSSDKPSCQVNENCSNEKHPVGTE